MTLSLPYMLVNLKKHAQSVFEEVEALLSLAYFGIRAIPKNPAN